MHTAIGLGKVLEGIQELQPESLSCYGLKGHKPWFWWRVL